MNNSKVGWVLNIMFMALCFNLFGQKANVHGDFPDLSIAKFGDYYCLATSSNWAPGFPILKLKP